MPIQTDDFAAAPLERIVSAGARSPNEEALEHFRRKKAFARWDPRVLQDYLDCGFEPDPDGLFMERAPAVGLLDGDVSTIDGLDAALGALDPRWQVDVLFALQDLIAGLAG